MPAEYPKWIKGATPHTNSKARVTRTRPVFGVSAIRVRGATYRGSQPIEGVFELVSPTPQQVAGEQRYEVYCAWFGVKPPTKYPRVSVNPEQCEMLPDYSGVVIDNISAD